MDKKIWIVIIVVILIILGSVYYFLKGPKTEAPSSEVNKGQVEAVVDNPLVDSIAKTNPFDVDINPIRGYKNPFSK